MHLKYKSGNSWVDYNLVVYPIGAYYFSSSSTSPANLFGGTWSAVTGRFLYMNAGTDVGGSNTHTHQYGVSFYSWFSSLAAGANADPDGTILGTTASDEQTTRSESSVSLQTNSGVENNRKIVSNPVLIKRTGSTTTSSTMPAYQTVYAWRRTA